jgi:hypothetical protein
VPTLNLPTVTDPPSLLALRENVALYETLRYILSVLRQLVVYMQENTITEITGESS